MKYINDYTSGFRVANFSDVMIKAPHVLTFDVQDTPAKMVKQIRKYADLPYVFVVGGTFAVKVPEIIETLRTIHSPCYPYALFVLDNVKTAMPDKELDVLYINASETDALPDKIYEHMASRFHFDETMLAVPQPAALPETTDVLIVGAGVTGLYAGNRLKAAGISFCITEKLDRIGGIWSMYANTTSRVNTSESAYRLIDKDARSNRDHSATREILEDIVRVAQEVKENLYLNTEIKKIEKTENGYRSTCIRDGVTRVIESKGIILAINDRVGPPRELVLPDREVFKGDIVTGISNKALNLDWKGKDVVVVGMGAFAVENVRTALESGARHVTVVCRRHGTICPKIIDYLNFATPYNEEFQHDKKSNTRNMIYWKKLYDTSGATQPECWMGKIKHDGHTISVSDIWFIGHYLKKIETRTGEIKGVYEDGIILNDQSRVKADIVVNCIGFERNSSAAKTVSGYTEMYNNNYVDRDFMYLADAYIDADAFNSFLGSSVLEMVRFYMEVYVTYFKNPDYEKMIGFDGIEKIPIEERKWIHYIKGAESLIKNNPELKAAVWKQINKRTEDFLEKHDLETYIAENKREWIDTHTMLAGKPVPEEECLPYVFEKLVPKA